MAEKQKQGFPTPEEDPRFHNTYQFLRRYRDAKYSLMVVVRQTETQFRMEYGTSIDDFWDSIYAAGVELTGGDISYRTYYRKRRAAIEALSTILWGFTAKETLNMLDQFFPEQ